MTVQCSHCGEPLMGSVNRCWQYGRPLVVAAGDPDLPPIRRPPVAIPSPEGMREGVPSVNADASETSSSEPLAVEKTSSAEAPEPPDTGHRGKPVVAQLTAEPIRRSPIRPRYPKKVFAESCAITSVVVGVLTALTSVLTVWSIIPAVVGIVLGVIGVGSDRRRTAAIGIALCCLAFMISAGRVSVLSYRAYERRQSEMWGEF